MLRVILSFEASFLYLQLKSVLFQRQQQQQQVMASERKELLVPNNKVVPTATVEVLEHISDREGVSC